MPISTSIEFGKTKIKHNFLKILPPAATASRAGTPAQCKPEGFPNGSDRLRDISAATFEQSALVEGLLPGPKNRQEGSPSKVQCGK